MKKTKNKIKVSKVVSLFVLNAVVSSAAAVTIEATNLDGLSLGVKIVGPVGPDVETSFVNGSGEAVGDLSSSVSCPGGFSACVPPDNPAGTIYTYIHVVTPGVDLPNDPPFPAPDVSIPFDQVTEFALGFPATGFNGVAGYSFGEAVGALVTDAAISIDLGTDDILTWTLPDASEWGTGETISFFWQTTQPPSGPGGSFGISNASGQGLAAGGPIPAAIPVVVPEPGTLLLMLGTVLFVGGKRVIGTSPKA